MARSLRRLDGRRQGPLSVHDVALLDELQALLGCAAAPAKREVDPVDQLTGLEEVTTFADRMTPARRDRADRLAEERTEYAHVIVDEAQDLTPMQWRMVGRRGRLATWTIVGDPAQSSWTDPEEAARARDEALGTRPRRRFTLTVNYRNPAEIAELAATVLALAMPGMELAERGALDRPGAPVRLRRRRPGRGGAREARRLLERGGRHGRGGGGHGPSRGGPGLAGRSSATASVALGSLEAKGLEYDATVVVSPAEIADESPAGLRVLYVALTRATQRLTVLSGERDQPDAGGVPDLLRD